jgi:two-component system sensor histidine kinase VicK
MVNVTASFNKQELVISVADEGRGIPKDMIPQAMKPFQRLSGLTRDPQEGAGLGLSIAARLAEAHGGKLQIDSEVAVGTTVYLRLRAERFMVVTP